MLPSALLLLRPSLLIFHRKPVMLPSESGCGTVRTATFGPTIRRSPRTPMCDTKPLADGLGLMVLSTTEPHIQPPQQKVNFNINLKVVEEVPINLFSKSSLVVNLIVPARAIDSRKRFAVTHAVLDEWTANSEHGFLANIFMERFSRGIFQLLLDRARVLYEDLVKVQVIAKKRANRNKSMKHRSDIA